MTQPITCPFCNGSCSFAYHVNRYEIYTCMTCGTGQTAPMPSRQELARYYKGFRFATDPACFANIERSVSLLLAFLDFDKRPLRMLDVGGGGGFYSLAFETLGFGSADYIDLDEEACKHARSLGLKNVVNDNAESTEALPHCYDLIFARHVIEHLINPTELITALASRLNDGGKLVLACPNGKSNEYFFFASHLFNHTKTILSDNGFSLHTLWNSFGRSLHHAIAPPRHLWAITEQGLRAFCEKSGLRARLLTLSIDDPLISPHFRQSPSSIIFHIQKRILKRKQSGAHLVCIIENAERRKD